MKFYSYKLFQNGPEVSFSYEEISHIYGISKGKAFRYIKEDCLTGMIFKVRRPFKKNCYRLSSLGLFYLHKDFHTFHPQETFLNQTKT